MYTNLECRKYTKYYFCSAHKRREAKRAAKERKEEYEPQGLVEEIVDYHPTNQQAQEYACELSLLDKKIKKSEAEIQQLQKALMSNSELINATKLWMEEGEKEINDIFDLFAQARAEKEKEMAEKKKEIDEEFEKYLLSLKET